MTVAGLCYYWTDQPDQSQQRHSRPHRRPGEMEPADLCFYQKLQRAQPLHEHVGRSRGDEPQGKSDMFEKLKSYPVLCSDYSVIKLEISGEQVQKLHKYTETGQCVPKRAISY